MNMIVALLLAGATPQATAEPFSHPDFKQVREQVEVELKGKLYDPDAGQIRWTRGFEWSSWKQGGFGILNKRRWGWLACGRINGKNLMGAYTGEQAVYAYVQADGAVRTGMAYDIDSWCDRFATGIISEEMRGRLPRP